MATSKNGIHKSIKTSRAPCCVNHIILCVSQLFDLRVYSHDIDNWRQPHTYKYIEPQKKETKWKFQFTKNVSQTSPHLGLLRPMCLCVILIAMSADRIIRKNERMNEKKNTETIDMAAVAAAARTLQIQLRSLRSADFVLHYNNRKKIKCRRLAGYLRTSQINAITFFSWLNPTSWVPFCARSAIHSCLGVNLFSFFWYVTSIEYLISFTYRTFYVWITYSHIHTLTLGRRTYVRCRHAINVYMRMR